MNATLVRSGLIALVISTVPVNSMIAPTMPQNSARGEPLFRYIILDTDYMNSDREDLAKVTVSILMDEKACSEDNLRRLFKFVSHRFKTPDWMMVFVYTSLDQLETPEQQDVPNPSDSSSKPMDCSHQSAFLSRHQGNEFLRYYPVVGRCEWKAVVLKGDPAAAN